MSTILKALRRLEREKSARSHRPLGEAVANASPPPNAAPPPRRRRARWLVAGGAFAGVLAIAAVVFLVLPLRDEAESEEPVEIAATPSKSPAARRAAKRRRRTTPRASAPSTSNAERPARGRGAEGQSTRRAEPPASRGLSPEALSSEVRVVKRVRPAEPESEPSAPEAAPAETPPRSQGETAAPAVTSGSAERTAAPPEPGPRSPAAPEAERGVPLASAAAAAKAPPAPRADPWPEAALRAAEPRPEAEPRAAEPRPEAAPRAAEPPPILRSPVPTVYVERTIWHPLAERRVAVVALEGSDETLELHEGDAVGSLVVGKIEPSGVFFVHDGIELRRRVGAR